MLQAITLRLKIAQKLYIVWSLGPKALNYESLEPKGYDLGSRRAAASEERRQTAGTFDDRDVRTCLGDELYARPSI